MKTYDYVLGLDPGFACLGYAILAVPPACAYALTNPGPCMVLGCAKHSNVEQPSRVLALGVVETEKAHKKLKIPAVEDNARRCRELSAALESLLDGKHPTEARTGAGIRALFDSQRITMVCAEAMSFPRSASVAAKVSLTWGLILHATFKRNVPLMQRSPQSVKKDVVGVIDASKKHVERVLVRQHGKAIRNLLRHYPTTLHEHAFDALAVATACRPR